MPRRNRTSARHVPPRVKPKGKKRPRGWHRADAEDRRWEEFARRWPLALAEDGGRRSGCT